MKKFLFLCALVGLTSFSAHAQEDLTGLTTSVSNSLSRPYIRPTLTRIYVTDGQSFTEKYAMAFSALEPAKYNYINADNEFFTLSEPATDMKENLTNLLVEQKVTKQIMRGWFPKFENGRYTVDMLLERGRYAMTDEDVVAANSGARSMETFATTFGKELIDRSYVVVYYMAQYTDKDGNPAGVQITPYVFKLDYGPKVAANFQKNFFKNPAGIDECEFPLIYVTCGKKNYLSTCPETTLGMEEDFDNVMVLIKDVADFQVKATVEGTLPVKANIGTKEGLYVDKRFDVVRLEEEFVTDEEGNETTQQVAKRRAVVRVKSVADNKGEATGEVEELSTFYKYRGLGIQEGYTLVENADQGMGVSVDLSFGHPSVAFDYRLGRYTKVPGLMAYIKAGLPLYSMGQVMEEYGVMPYNASIGVAKEFNFAPFYVTPGVDAGALATYYEEEVYVLGYTASANVKAGFYMTPTTQLYATLGYVLMLADPGYFPNGLDHMPINVGVGFKVNF